MKIFQVYLFLLFICKAAFAQDSLNVHDSHEIVINNSYSGDTLVFKGPNLLKNIGKVPNDLWFLAKSPFQKKNFPGLVAVALSTGILVWKDQQIINWVRNTSDDIGLDPASDFKVLVKVGKTRILKVPGNINTFFYQLGEGGTSLALAGGLWIFGKIKKDMRAKSTAGDLVETYISMGIASQVLKRVSGRESPFVATAPGGRWRPFPSFSQYQKKTSTYDAFPSGHLATMMATVTVLTSNYPEKKWIKPVGYSIMGLSCWAMMNTEVHWAGDYPLALATGYLAGKITTARHRKKYMMDLKF